MYLVLGVVTPGLCSSMSTSNSALEITSALSVVVDELMLLLQSSVRGLSSDDDDVMILFKFSMTLAFPCMWDVCSVTG